MIDATQKTGKEVIDEMEVLIKNFSTKNDDLLTYVRKNPGYAHRYLEIRLQEIAGASIAIESVSLCFAKIVSESHEFSQAVK